LVVEAAQESDAVKFHSVYLQRRQPGVSYRDFQRLWRSHGDFAASVPAFWPHVQCYVHNDPLEDAKGLPAGTRDYDAVGELYYTDYATWLAMRDVMVEVVAPDERRVFNGPSTAVRGDRTVFVAPTGLYKLFTFARLACGFALNDRLAEILSRHAKRTLETPDFGAHLAGYTMTCSRRHAPETGMDERPQTRSNMDILFTHHFADELAARRAVGSAGYAHITTAEQEFLDVDSRIGVLTHAWNLKGDPASAS
jgi:hypothetical protein